MKTEKAKVGLYRHIKYGAEGVGKIGSYNNEYILVSDVIEVEFNIIDASAEKDTLKALKVEAVQNRIKLARAELESLL